MASEAASRAMHAPWRRDGFDAVMDMGRAGLREVPSSRDDLRQIPQIPNLSNAPATKSATVQFLPPAASPSCDTTRKGGVVPSHRVAALYSGCAIMALL